MAKKKKPEAEKSGEVIVNEELVGAIEPEQTPEIAPKNLGLKEKILERIKGGK